MRLQLIWVFIIPCIVCIPYPLLDYQDDIKNHDKAIVGGRTRRFSSRSYQKRVDSSIPSSLGTWTTSITSVSTQQPEISTDQAFRKVTDNLWNLFWNKNSSNWNDQCDNTNTPVVWSVAVASKAITDTHTSSTARSVINALLKYRNSQNNGFLASTAGNNDIYVDDDAQVVWVFTDAAEILYDNTVSQQASDTVDFIEKQKNNQIGGITWSINDVYVASISTLEAGLAAMKLYAVNSDASLISFAKYTLGWSFDNLLDQDNKFFYDGVTPGGGVNKGQLSYTVGVAISTLAYLERYDGGDSDDWRAIAVELAVRAIGGGKLDSIFFSGGHLSNDLKYSHLLLVGFADLLSMTSPSSQYQQEAYDAIRATVVREARNYYDSYSSYINSQKCGGVTSLLEYGSLAQSLYAASVVADQM